MIYSSVSIINVTRRLNYINNILNNFLRQNIENIELIIVINNNSINMNDYKKLTANYHNIHIYTLDESITLGSCLNFAIKKCKYDIIAKFDDDDYYGPLYSQEILKNFNTNDCQVIGKTKTFIYFEKYNQLMLKKTGCENNLVNTVSGSTLSFKKELFDKISFKDIDIQEDKYFCNDCLKNKYKIYSTSAYNHIVFKHSNVNDHTFKFNIELLIKLCTPVKKNLCFEDSFSLVNYLK